MPVRKYGTDAVLSACATDALTAPQKAQEGEYATPYHWFWTPNSQDGRAYFSYLKRVAEFIPPEVGILLDIGCGDGRTTAYFADLRPRARVIGADYSERALALAAAMSAPRPIEWMPFDLCGGESSLSGVDVVTAIEILEHLPPGDLPRALERIFSLLSPGGRFLVSVPSVLMPITPKHYQHFSADGIRALMAAAGFEVKRLIGQQRHGHSLFQLYRFFENRYWTIKPLVRWFNAVLYPKRIDPSAPECADRLIIEAIRPG